MSLSRSLQYLFLAIIVTTVGFSLYQWNASRASTQKTAPNNGLVGYWSFNEGTGTQAGDASVNKNTGTLTNGPTWVSGKLGQALNFDGVNDYVNITDNFPMSSSNITISLWLNQSAHTGAGGGFASLISKNPNGNDSNFWDWGILFGPSNDTVYLIRNTSNLSLTSVAIPKNRWVHVVAIISDTQSKLYLDGILGDSQGGVGSGSTFNTAGRYVQIMGNGGGNSSAVTGKVDEVRIYNRALSGTEITNLYNLGAEKLNVSPVSNLTSGLVGYWTFDGKDTPWSSSSAGTATDRSGNSNTGTLTNMSQSTSPAEGKLGQALNFDGSNDYIALSTLQTAGATTLSAWIYPNNVSGRKVIVGRLESGSSFPYNYGYGLLLNGSTLIGMSAYNDLSWANNLNATVQAGVWQHVVFTITGSSGTQTGSLYVNGTLVDSYSGTANPTIAYPYGIGAGLGNFAGSFFNGTIDDVRSYNRALSAGEIQSLYDLGASDKVNSSVSQNQGTGRLDSGLAGYWKLDDASGTTATDSSTNGNNGTLTNGPTWGTGQVGGDVVFDGTDDYITVPQNGKLNVSTTAFTVSMWAKDDSTYAVVNATAHRFISWFDGTNNIQFGLIGALTPAGTRQYFIGNQPSNSYARNVTSIAGGVSIGWHHVVGTYDGVIYLIYVDGVASGGGTHTNPLGTFTSNSTTLYIGQRGDAGFTSGSLDEVRVYNRALSVDEVSQLYRLTAPTGVDTSLKGYWSFNGPDLSGTTAYDRSGSANNGILTNGPTITEGKLGQALNFDGVDDYVNMGSSATLDLTTSHTMSAWINPTTLPTATSELAVFGHGSASCCGTGYAVGLKRNNGGGYDAVYYRTSAGLILEPHITLTTKVWHHIVVTWNGTTATMYIDGSNSASNSLSSPISLFNSNSVIGRERSDSAYLFNGQIDEVRVYNRALSSTEVSALYNAGR